MLGKIKLPTGTKASVGTALAHRKNRTPIPPGVISSPGASAVDQITLAGTSRRMNEETQSLRRKLSPGLNGCSQKIKAPATLMSFIIPLVLGTN